MSSSSKEVEGQGIHDGDTFDVEKQIDRMAIVPQYLPYPEKIIKLTSKPNRKLVLNIYGQIGNESFHFPLTD